MQIKRLGFIAAACLPLWCATAATAAVTLDFQSGVTTGGLVNDGNGGYYFSQYLQDGFIAYSQSHHIPGIHIFTRWTIGGGSAYTYDQSGLDAVLDINAGGSPFTLQAVQVGESTADFASICWNPPPGYSPPGDDVLIQGFSGGVNVMTWSPRSGCPTYTMFDRTNPFASVVIDDLQITSWAFTGMIVDNMVLTPVPEPSTALLTGAGLVALGATRRRQRQLL